MQVKELLKQDSVDVNLPENDDYTPFMWAVANKQDDIV